MKNINLPEDKIVYEAILDFIHQFFLDEELRDARSVAPDSIIEHFKNQSIPNDGREVNEVVQELLTDVYPYILKQDHPRAFGFIPGPASKLSLLGDVMTQAFNVHASNWINSSAASTIEAQLIEWLGAQIGYDKSCGGLFVSGGSMANLTGLIAARDRGLSDDVRHLGVVYLSDQTHHSVEKALYMIGYTRKQVRFIPTNAMFQMDVTALQRAIQEDIAFGYIPTTVIANAGTTNTGTVDCLNDIANITENYGIWLHVDGAYGASFLLSPSQKYLLDGIERADSVSWDAHKLLFQTYSCAMIIVKDKHDLLNSFSANPEYLQDIDGGATDFASLGIELTRPARALKLWLTLQVLGTDELAKRIEHGQKLVELAELTLQSMEHWEIVSNAHFNIVNFRYNHPDFNQKENDALNVYAANEIVNSGFAGVFTTILDGKTVIRICSTNPATTEQDILETINRLSSYVSDFIQQKK